MSLTLKIIITYVVIDIRLVVDKVFVRQKKVFGYRKNKIEKIFVINIVENCVHMIYIVYYMFQ